MGNSESSVKNETILSDARPSLTENISRSLELLEEIEMENVIISLNWVDSCSNNAALLQHIADEIIRLSLAAPYTSSLSMNYLNLAKKLSHFTVSDTREVETFRDIFLKVCFEYYEACKSNEQEFNKTKKLSQFLGNLYNVGIVSSAFLSYWLRSLNSLSQTMILQVIKSKVEQEFEKPEPELCILEMRTMLIERKLIQIET